MTPSVDETRRAFLLRMAKTVAFVPPAIATLSVSRAAALGGPPAGTPGGPPAGTPASQVAAPVATQVTQATTAPVAQQQAVVGTLTPVASTTVAPSQIQLQQQDGGAVPWSPGSRAGTPPWSRPPPTQSGG